jgi:hypothetical protein
LLPQRKTAMDVRLPEWMEGAQRRAHAILADGGITATEELLAKDVLYLVQRMREVVFTAEEEFQKVRERLQAK